MSVQTRVSSERTERFDPERLQPIIFDPVHNKYRVIGEVAGIRLQDGLALK